MADLQGQGGWGVDIANTGHLVYASDTETTLARIPDGTPGQVLAYDASSPSKASFQDVSSAITGQPLTKVDDTNVTLTLGGSPTTALIAATSLTLGWTGQLSLARGGSGADLSATGGAGQYVKQASAGAAFTVGTIPASDIVSAAALTKTDDTNVTLTLGGSPTVALLAAASLTLGWTGTLAAGRLNANVVQGITNDTNVTGSIAAQVLTLGWTGTLAAARLNANVVQGITNDTNVTGSISAQNLTLGWTGTLAAGRLNANVVQSVVNDTNITGSIATQALTLGWTGTLAAARLNANVVQAITNDTNLQGSIATQMLTLSWAGTLAPARGGLGFDASAVAKGGMITGTGAGTLGITAVGTDGLVWTADAASPGGAKWSAAGSGTVSGSGTTGKIPKWSSSSALTDSILSESSGIVSAAAGYYAVDNTYGYAIKDSGGTNRVIASIDGSNNLFIGAGGGLTTLQLRASTTTGMTVLPGGNVGVGNIAPGYLLSLKGASPAIEFQNASSSNKSWRFESSVNDLTLVETGVANQVTFKAGGNVLFSSAIAVAGAIATHQTSSLVITQDSSTVSQIRAYGADATTAGILHLLGLANDGSPQVNWFYGDASGNVAVGNTGPEGRLHVSGGALAISSNSATVSPSGYDLKVRSSTSLVGIHTDSASGTPTLEFGNGASGYATIKSTAAVPLYLQTNSTTAVTIDASQNVAINATKKLYLDGGGDTYLIESSANVFNIFTAGNKTWGVNAAGDLTYNGNIILSPGTPTITADSSGAATISGTDGGMYVHASGSPGTDPTTITITVSFGHTFSNTPTVLLSNVVTALSEGVSNPVITACSTTSFSFTGGTVAGTLGGWLFSIRFTVIGH